MTTVRNILKNASAVNDQSSCQAQIDGVRIALAQDLGIPESDIVKIPALYQVIHLPGFEDPYSWMPNMVNALVVGNTVIMGKPFGPRQGGVDLFVRNVQQNPNLASYDIRFVDSWAFSGTAHGGVHCATNAKRVPPGLIWW